MPADNSARWLSAIRYCPSNARYRRPAKAPLAIVGVVWRSQTGGIPRAAGFHIGLYFEEVPAVESLSHGFAVPAPFHKGALRAVPADNSARWLSAIRYCPSNARYRRPAKAPLAIVGVVWRSQTGGIPRVAGFQIGLYFEEVPAVESLSHGFAVPAPFHKGAFGVLPGMGAFSLNPLSPRRIFPWKCL